MYQVLKKNGFVYFKIKITLDCKLLYKEIYGHH